MLKIKFTKPKILLFDSKGAKRMMDVESRRTMAVVLVKTQGEIKDRTPVGVSGELQNSIMIEMKKIKERLIGFVFSALKYALPMNFGRKASPVSKLGQLSILRWVEKSSAGRALWQTLKGRYPKITPRQVAFLVARQKKLKRMEGKKFFEKGIQASLSFIRGAFSKHGLTLKRRLTQL